MKQGNDAFLKIKSKPELLCEKKKTKTLQNSEGA